MQAHGGFQWPKAGAVSAPDWHPGKHCGNGLHGLLWGQGDGNLLCWDQGAHWLVVEVDAKSIVDLQGKVKFPRGTVVHCGDRSSAAAFIVERRPDLASVIIGGTATAGYRGTATAGYRGTATAGDYGTATAGDYGTATAGYRGTATAGEGGTISVMWWDGRRRRIVLGYVGEDGIEAGAKYCVVEGKLTKIAPEVTP